MWLTLFSISGSVRRTINHGPHAWTYPNVRILLQKLTGGVRGVDKVANIFAEQQRYWLRHLPSYRLQPPLQLDRAVERQTPNIRWTEITFMPW